MQINMYCNDVVLSISQGCPDIVGPFCLVNFTFRNSFASTILNDKSGGEQNLIY